MDPLPNQFILGEGQDYGIGDFFNHPLNPLQLYHVFVRAYTTDNVS